MKLDTAGNTILYEDSEVSEELEFSIGDAGVIIEILRSKMYTFPIRTLVQEYLCNARDACREKAGATGDDALDVEVHLPTKSDPTFSVRDY